MLDKPQAVIKSASSAAVPLCDGLGSSAEICVTLPENNRREYDSRAIVIFINGVGNTSAQSIQSASLLSNHKDTPVYRVYNDKELLPIVGGVMHGVISKFNRRVGGYFESNAVRGLLNVLLDAYKKNKQIEVHAHSQGGIIVRDTLDFLKQYLSTSQDDEVWSEFVSRVHVYVYGTAEHDWEDVSVTEYTFTGDPISLISRYIDRIRMKLSTLKAKKVTIDTIVLQEPGTFSHAFKNYIDQLSR